MKTNTPPKITSSALGRHSRYVASAEVPLLIRSITAPAAISVRCGEDATAVVELSLSDRKEQDPVFAPSAFGTVKPGKASVEHVPFKISQVRVTVTGTGSAIVETLE